jgi:hypothetical protein
MFTLFAKVIQNVNDFIKIKYHTKIYILWLQSGESVYKYVYEDQITTIINIAIPFCWL